MPLTSQFFRGDSRLEGAAVRDAEHIFAGARGDFVGKIQTALNLLDGAGLDVDNAFGPLTAAAVSTYKRKRGIVNYAGQIDPIVGRGTMTALDGEMAKREQLPPPPNKLPDLPPPEPPPPESTDFAIRAEAETDGGVPMQANYPPDFFQIVDMTNKRAAVYRYEFPEGRGVLGMFPFEATLRRFRTERAYALERLENPADYMTTINVDEDGVESFQSALAIRLYKAATAPPAIPMFLHASLRFKVASRPSSMTSTTHGHLRFVKLIDYPPPRMKLA